MDFLQLGIDTQAHIMSFLQPIDVMHLHLVCRAFHIWLTEHDQAISQMMLHALNVDLKWLHQRQKRGIQVDYKKALIRKWNYFDPLDLWMVLQPDPTNKYIQLHMQHLRDDLYVFAPNGQKLYIFNIRTEKVVHTTSLSTSRSVTRARCLDFIPEKDLILVCTRSEIWGVSGHTFKEKVIFKGNGNGIEGIYWNTKRQQIMVMYGASLLIKCVTLEGKIAQEIARPYFTLSQASFGIMPSVTNNILLLNHTNNKAQRIPDSLDLISIDPSNPEQYTVCDFRLQLNHAEDTVSNAYLVATEKGLILILVDEILYILRHNSFPKKVNSVRLPHPWSACVSFTLDPHGRLLCFSPVSQTLYIYT